MDFVLVLVHQAVVLLELLVADVAVIVGVHLLHMLGQGGRGEEPVLTLLARPHVALLHVGLHLGSVEEALAAVVAGLVLVRAADVGLHVLDVVGAVAALVDHVQVLGHAAGFDHLHAELAARLPVLGHSGRSHLGLLLRRHGLGDRLLGRRNRGCGGLRILEVLKLSLLDW